MSTSSSEEKPDFRKGSQVAGWTVLRRIGSGGFGTVYEVTRNGMHAAMKTEFVYKDRSGSLRHEVKQLRLLQSSPHFCRLLLACKSVYDRSFINVMVMSLAGRSLSTFRRHTPANRFSKSTSFRLAQQSLQALQDMHTVGIIHRDVKASNFAWCPQQRLVYLLDLGFCRRYIDVAVDGTAVHRPPRPYVSFMGTAKYCSMNVHNRREQSRRDDLWSWLYMFVEFVTGKLVWSERSEHMQAVFKEHLGSKLCAGCPLQMYAILDHIRMLQYHSRPNYSLLHSKISEYISERRIRDRDPFDWEEGGCHYEHMQKAAKSSRDDAVGREPRIAVDPSWLSETMGERDTDAAEP